MKNRKWKRITNFLLIVSGCFVLSEIYLRSYWGFCDSVLMMESKKYEYIAKPKQDRFRFRNQVRYNSFSMRSPEPDSNAYKILGFGDSIINGGVMVDQDSLSTTLLSFELARVLNEKVQVLNIGSGSWGPDNNFAYLQEKGNFGAKMIFLVVSSHDAFDNMDFTPVIDKVIRYESKQYKLATWELIDKYLLPKIAAPSSTEEVIYKNGRAFNTGFENFYNYCKSNGLPFFLYLNPDRNELTEKKYNWQGQLIIDFCSKREIPLIQGIKTTCPEDYRGIIHMNNSGQRHMAAAILPQIQSMIEIRGNESFRN